MRIRQWQQTTQGNVLFDGGNHAVAHPAQQGGAQYQRLIGAQHLAHAWEQAAFLAILSVGTREDQPHHVSPRAEQAVGGIEDGADVRLRLPGQREIAAVVLDGHEREGDLETVRHLPFRGRANDIRFRAARLIVQVFQPREQALAFGCAPGPGVGENHQHRQKCNRAVLIHGNLGSDIDGPRNGAGTELVLKLPHGAVGITSFKAGVNRFAPGLQFALGLRAIGETKPAHLPTGQVADHRSALAEGHRFAGEPDLKCAGRHGGLDHFEVL